MVEPGARVEEGQVVAEVPSGQLGSKIHTSIAGTVPIIVLIFELNCGRTI